MSAKGWFDVSAMWSASDNVLFLLIDELRMSLFEVGERLPSMKELSAMLGTSHVIVREALTVLENEGIVEIKRGRSGGIYVAGTTGFPDCLRSLYGPENRSMLLALISAREVIEQEVAIRASATVNAEELTVLRSLVDSMGEAVGDAEVFVELTVRFHLRLAVLAGNPVLTHFTREILNRLGAAGVSSRRAQMTGAQLADAHAIYTDLLEAVVAGDTKRIRRAVARHIATLQTVTLNSLDDPNHNQTTTRKDRDD